MNKRGQAAMEFLMTYGWAILAAIIAIGVLAYFGVFSPGKYVSDSCFISQPFGCEESSVTAGAAGAGLVNMVIRNGLGDSAVISEVTVGGCTDGTWSGTIADASTGAVTLTCANALDSGERLKGDIKITYKKGTTGTLDQISTGSITKKIP